MIAALGQLQINVNCSNRFKTDEPMPVIIEEIVELQSASDGLQETSEMSQSDAEAKDSHIRMYPGAKCSARESMLAILYLASRPDTTMALLTIVLDLLKLHIPENYDVEHLKLLYKFRQVCTHPQDSFILIFKSNFTSSLSETVSLE